MNVLVALGALVSFIYSLTGMFYYQDSNYLFFETTASIITLVFLGNFLEESTMRSTQRALQSLVKHQKVMANMIAFDDKHEEQIFPIENTQLKTGDLILIKTGEQVPVDCKILWGDCLVSEAIITGESIPLNRTKKDILIMKKFEKRMQKRLDVRRIMRNDVDLRLLLKYLMSRERYWLFCH